MHSHYDLQSKIDGVLEKEDLPADVKELVSAFREYVRDTESRLKALENIPSNRKALSGIL